MTKRPSSDEQDCVEPPTKSPCFEGNENDGWFHCGLYSLGLLTLFGSNLLFAHSQTSNIFSATFYLYTKFLNVLGGQLDQKLSVVPSIHCLLYTTLGGRRQWPANTTEPSAEDSEYHPSRSSTTTESCHGGHMYERNDLLVII